MKEREELSIVTEVGMFGELDMNDPTVKPVKSIDSMIEDAIQQNSENL